MSKELWKPILGYEEYYSVSSLGRIRRDKQSCGTQKGLILKQSKDLCGYPIVFLRGKGKKTWCVHKLVAYSFFGKKPVGLAINHKDGNKSNNYLENLEYITNSENCKHAYRNGLIKIKTGENSNLSKLKNSDIEKIRYLWVLGNLTQRSIAKLYNIDQSNVSYIVRRKTWKTILSLNHKI